MLKDVIWLTLGRFVSLASPLIVTPLAARILTKDQLGTWALIQLVVGFIALFQDGGLGPYVIRQTQYKESARPVVLSCSIFLGLFVSIVFFGISWPVCLLLDIQDYWILFIPLAGVYACSGLSGALMAELRKYTRFKLLFLTTAIPQILGTPLTFYLLLRGQGLWAFPISALFSAVVQVFLLVISTRPLNFGWNSLIFREMISYTRGIFGFTLINYWARKLDDLLVGRFLGTAQLSIYANAYRMMILPLNQVISVFNPLILPYMAKYQDNLESCRHELYKFLQIIGLIIFPVMTFLWLEREYVVNLYLGPGWNDVAHLLFWFAPLGMLQCLINPLGNCYMISGKNDHFFWMGVINTIVVSLSFVLGLPYGIKGVAISYLIANIIMIFPNIHIAASCINGSFLEWLKQLAPLFLIPSFSYFIRIGFNEINDFPSWINSIFSLFISFISILIVFYQKILARSFILIKSILSRNFSL